MTAYQNKSSQAERKQVLRNDARVRSGSTFFDHTHNNDEGGRYAKPMNVTGSTPTVEYPRLPSGPWADPVQIPPEEPLGYGISEAPIVGEPHEIEALDDTAYATNVADVAASPCGEVVVSSSTLGDVTEAVAQSAPLAAVAAPSSVVLASPADVERTAAIPTPKPTETR